MLATLCTGSHATMRLLEDGYAVTIIDNFSRGNPGAISVLQKMAPLNKLRVIHGDLVGWYIVTPG